MADDPPTGGTRPIHLLVVSGGTSDVMRQLAGMDRAFGVEVDRFDLDDPRRLSAEEIEDVDVVVLDSDVVDDGGWALVELLCARSPMVERVVVCGSETTDSSIAAARSGVRAIVTRPVKRSRLIQAIVGAWVRKRRTERRMTALRSQDDG